MSAGPLLKGVVSCAGAWTLRRDDRGRPAFPFVRRQTEPRYLVLTYHRTGENGCPFFPGVPLPLFERQMELLAASHRVLPLEDLLERAGRGDLPPNAVAVTFDDGYVDVRRNAAPILTRYGISATIFLTTGPLDGQGPLWHDRVFSAFRRSDGRPILIEGVTYPMATIAERRAALHAFLSRARREAPAARDARIRDLHERMALAPDDADLPAMLSWDDVAALSRDGIRFGAHTVTHPILTTIGPEEAAREIVESKRAIERRLDRPVRLFAYPNGGRLDFDERVKAAVRGAGFEGAVTTLWGTNDAARDPFELRRVNFWGTDPRQGILRLAWYRLSG